MANSEEMLEEFNMEPLSQEDLEQFNKELKRLGICCINPEALDKNTARSIIEQYQE